MFKKSTIIAFTLLITTFLFGYTFVPGVSPWDVSFDDNDANWIVQDDYRILNQPIFPSSNFKNYTITLPTNSVLEYRNKDSDWIRVPSNTSGASEYNIFKFTATHHDEWGEYWSISSSNTNFQSMTYFNEAELDSFAIRYFYKDVTNLNPDDYHTVADLPSTNGSVFSESMDMGYANVNINGLNMILTVAYNNQHYYLQYSFEPGTDMSIFDDREAYYYTYEGEKFVVFNQGNYSMFTAQNFKTQTFVPFTVWNLTTNELETFDRFNVYLYSRKEDANNVYAYFYVDEFVIDNLLSVSLAFKYRYNYMIGNPGKWQEVYKVLEADKEYFGDTTSWQYDLLNKSINAFNIAGLFTGNFSILLMGTATLQAANHTNLVQQGRVLEIQDVIPTTQLRSEIETAYKQAYSDFNTINPNLKLFKLHLGQFNKEWSSGIEIDSSYSVENTQKGINIMQFTYVTQGQVYTVEGKNINPIFVAGPGTNPQPENPIQSLLDEIINGIIIVAVIIIALIVIYFLFKNGVLTNPRKFLGFLFILAIIFGIFLAYRAGIFNSLLFKI